MTNLGFIQTRFCQVKAVTIAIPTTVGYTTHHQQHQPEKEGKVKPLYSIHSMQLVQLFISLK